MALSNRNALTRQQGQEAKTRNMDRYQNQGSIRKSLLQLLFLFTASLILLASVYSLAPDFTKDEAQHVKLPKNFDDARNLGQVLENYKDTHYKSVLLCYFTSYLFLVSFSIPGSTFLSVLAGFLYPSWMAMFFVCLSSAIGAGVCYTLADVIGKVFVDKYLSERVEKWRVTVDKNRNDLMSYILFLRITPFLPNWFINITSPVLNIPMRIFFWATFFGVAPLSFIAVSAGKEIHKLVTFGDAVSTDAIFLCAAAAVVSILPILAKKLFAEKFGMTEEKDKDQ